MKMLYALRVALVSLEALLLFAATLVLLQFQKELDSFAASLNSSQEVVKVVFLLPMAMAAWVIKESRLLLQDEKQTIRVLTKWEDYWRLKTHVWVSLFYVALFFLLSIFPWVLTSGVGSGLGLLPFLTSLVGQFLVAVSIYAARLRIKEIIVHVDAL